MGTTGRFAKNFFFFQTSCKKTPPPIVIGVEGGGHAKTTAKGTRQEPFDPILNPLGQIGDEVSSLFSTNSSPCFWDLPSFALCHFPRRRVHRPGGAAPPLPPSKNPQQACVRPAGGSSAEGGDRWSAFLHHRFVFLQGVVPLGVVLIVSVVGEQAGFLQPAG